MKLVALKSFTHRGRLIRQGEVFEERSPSRVIGLARRGFVEPFKEEKEAPAPENKAAPGPETK